MQKKPDSILRTILGFTLVTREYDSINLRLGRNMEKGNRWKKNRRFAIFTENQLFRFRNI
jgi:hypothetical protein